MNKIGGNYIVTAEECAKMQKAIDSSNAKVAVRLEVDYRKLKENEYNNEEAIMFYPDINWECSEECLESYVDGLALGLSRESNCAIEVKATFLFLKEVEVLGLYWPSVVVEARKPITIEKTVEWRQEW